MIFWKKKKKERMNKFLFL
uniref:Uncharacterized protein n=1 Tax=Rhizophora mucronata TaxID=61149 RepID=A0A2P2KA09_RHIMU